ncbi:MAG TPA: DUF350 domain-containing protein [Syntrophales bacterium]|nr:DUF350 domain-containing protein [Syntrophales bacterium]
MERYGMIVVYMALILAFLYLSKRIADVLTKFDDDLAVEKEANTAVALRRFGLYVGICTALAGVFQGGLRRADLVVFLTDGAITTVLFFAAHLLNDRILVPGVRNNDLIKAGNVPTGIVEAGSFIATGILLNGAFAGEVGGILSAMAFFGLGQLFLYLAVFMHQRIYRFRTAACLREGNLSAGITVAGLLVAYSIILRSSIAGDFTGWAESLGWFLISAASGMLFLLIFQKVSDWIFLPKTKLEDQIQAGNTAAALLVQGLVIALAVVISRMIV